MILLGLAIWAAFAGNWWVFVALVAWYLLEAD